MQNLRRTFQGIATALRFAFRGNDTQLDPFGFRLDCVKLTRAKDIQVTGHGRRRLETDFTSTGDFPFARNRHIRDRHPVFRHDDAQLKTRAKSRLVPAGEESARIGRFELRAKQ